MDGEPMRALAREVGMVEVRAFRGEDGSLSFVSYWCDAEGGAQRELALAYPQGSEGRAVEEAGEAVKDKLRRLLMQAEWPAQAERLLPGPSTALPPFLRNLRHRQPTGGTGSGGSRTPPRPIRNTRPLQGGA